MFKEAKAIEDDANQGRSRSNDMDSAAMTALGAAGSAVLGYFLGSINERSMERRRANYAAKLELYRELTRQLERIQAAYWNVLRFEGMHPDKPESMKPCELYSVLQFLKDAGLARDCGLDSVMFDSMRTTLTEPDRLDDKTKVEILMAALNASSTVVGLYGIKVICLVNEANLVADTERLAESTDALDVFLTEQRAKLNASMAKGDPFPKLESHGAFQSICQDMSEAMKHDLELTMKSKTNQVLSRHREGKAERKMAKVASKQ